MRDIPQLSGSVYSLYEDFSRYPDATVMAGKVPRRGPAWGSTGASPVSTINGYLYNPSTPTGYLFANLPGKPQVIGTRHSWSGGSDLTAKSAAMSFSSQTPGSLTIKNLLHLNWGPLSFTLGYFDTASTFFPLTNGEWLSPMNNTGTLYDVECCQIGDTCVVIGPGGEQFITTNPNLTAQWGAMVFWEPLTQADGLSARFRTAYTMYRIPLAVRRLYAATFNPSDKTSTVTLSNGNLTATCNAATAEPQARSVEARSTGNVHFEFTINAHAAGTTGNLGIGIASMASHALTTYTGGDTFSFGFYPRTNGAQYYKNNVATTMTSFLFNAGDVGAIEINLDTNKAWLKNVTSGSGWNNDVIANQNPATGVGGIVMSSGAGAPYGISATLEALNDAITINTGATPFGQPPSVGFGNW